jgi:hypothetical protein
MFQSEFNSILILGSSLLVYFIDEWVGGKDMIVSGLADA